MPQECAIEHHLSNLRLEAQRKLGALDHDLREIPKLHLTSTRGSRFFEQTTTLIKSSGPQNSSYNI